MALIDLGGVGLPTPPFVQLSLCQSFLHQLVVVFPNPQISWVLSGFLTFLAFFFLDHFLGALTEVF
jgi:hypothetical protein